MENKNCQVVPDAQGNAIRVSKNSPEYGYVRVIQNKVMFNANGWVSKKQLSTLVKGKVEDLQDLGFDADTELTGNIIVMESFEPFSEKFPDRDLKMAGDTGIVCCEHGQPIYRKTFYDASGTMEDTYIAHTNGDAIRAANAGDVEEEEIANVVEQETKSKTKSKKEEIVEEPVEETVEMEEETFEL